MSVGGFYFLTHKAKSDLAGPGSTPTGRRSNPAVTSTDPIDAKVGNCLAGETLDSTTAKEVNNIKIVDCTSTDAKYRVVGIVAGKTEVQFDADDHVCALYPSAESALWQGTTGKVGSVLCLEPTKK
ncbi:MAG: hypothetical protein AUI14_13600 [Actinobacteria bacterium 13_2_20CM_2_71_6]|nr:MAG: hypothetical protein AUI14_13600 [Actinobacteria bacterium 13_2_20CM_2_71_6]